MKVIPCVALIMALVAGQSAIHFPRYERIDIGRPLGKMYIKFTDGDMLQHESTSTYELVGFERRGTGTYALVHDEYSVETGERKLKGTLQVGVKYLPQLPRGWEEADWKDRPSMVADALLSAKRPDRSGRTCWAGPLYLAPGNGWTAVSYQQTFYTRDGAATDNYRGIFLVSRPPTGGLVLLDLYKKRRSPDDVKDWEQVRNYLGSVNRMLHFNDEERPHLADGDDAFKPLPIPSQNPLCLGPYRLALPSGTKLITEAGGWYRLNNERRGVEARLSYRERLTPGFNDPVEELQPQCEPRRQPLTTSTRDPSAPMRYVRNTNAEGRCTPYFQGLMKRWLLPGGAAITLDVFVRSPSARAQPLPSAWPQIDSYLRELEQQVLSRCDRPGTGNRAEDGKPAPVSVLSDKKVHALPQVDATSPGRCVS